MEYIVHQNQKNKNEIKSNINPPDRILIVYKLIGIEIP